MDSGSRGLHNLHRLHVMHVLHPSHMAAPLTQLCHYNDFPRKLLICTVSVITPCH